MNASTHIRKARPAAGILLIECLVYMAVFAVLTGVGMATFYFCWNTTQGVVRETDDIGAALRAGERWRADVRHAQGNIAVASSADGQTLRIPGSQGAVIYHFEAGKIRREAPRLAPQWVLSKVKASEMTHELRGGVGAWRWELELSELRSNMHLPLVFTFEAAPPTP